jgi:hypothetical protein
MSPKLAKTTVKSRNGWSASVRTAKWHLTAFTVTLPRSAMPGRKRPPGWGDAGAHQRGARLLHCRRANSRPAGVGDGLTVHCLDLTRMPGWISARSGKDVEHHRRLRRIGNDIERSVAGHVAGIAVALGNHAADGRIDRIDLQALARLDARKQLAPPDIVAHRLGDADDASGKLPADLRAPGGRKLDGAEQLARFADHRGTGSLDHYAIGLGQLGRDPGLALGAGIFPLTWRLPSTTATTSTSKLCGSTTVP